MEGNACYNFHIISNYISRSPSNPAPILRAIDVGCRVGLITRMMVNHFPQAMIHAYDVLPYLIRLTLETVNDNPRVAAILGACTAQHLYADNLGQEPQESELYVNEAIRARPNPRKSGGASIVSKQPAKNRSVYAPQKMAIPCYTLQEMYDRLGGVDVLKMDCEGCENSLLGCADIELLGKIRFIVGEYHHLPTFRPVIRERLLKTHRVKLIPGRGPTGCFFAEIRNVEDSIFTPKNLFRPIYVMPQHKYFELLNKQQRAFDYNI
jgi:FkbM family methyltransferase